MTSNENNLKWTKNSDEMTFNEVTYNVITYILITFNELTYK